MKASPKFGPVLIKHLDERCLCTHSNSVSVRYGGCACSYCLTYMVIARSLFIELTRFNMLSEDTTRISITSHCCASGEVANEVQFTSSK